MPQTEVLGTRFATASPTLLHQRALLRRFDAKLIVPRAQLEGLLSTVASAYSVVCAPDARPAQTYESVYFDTADLRCFHDHRRGRRPRFKVRIRRYVDRQKAFLEVKRKDNDERTTKERVEWPFDQTPQQQQSLAEAETLPMISEVAERLGAPLQFSMRNRFSRITLLGIDVEERITIDIDLHAADQTSELREVDMSAIAVVEVKQPRVNHHTPMVRACRSIGVRPGSMSKYCLGLAALGRVERVSAFAPALKRLQRAEQPGASA